MEKILSIIIPVYNVRDYIIKCVENLIIKRDDYEIILIDDGSTDGTSLICDTLDKSYSQVMVIHTINKGVSVARNIGINKANGKYIYFVDGDDVFYGLDNLLEQLDLKIDKLYAVPYHIIGKDKILYVREIACISNESIDSYSKSMQSLFHACWGYVFPYSLIRDNGIYFHEGIAYAEDWAFTIQCLSLSNAINPLIGCCYKYRSNRDGSAMNIKKDSSLIFKYFQPFGDMSKFILVANCKSIVFRQQGALLNYILSIIRDNQSNLNIAYCAKSLRQCVNFELIKYAHGFIKIKFILVKIHISLYLFLVKSYRRLI